MAKKSSKKKIILIIVGIILAIAVLLIIFGVFLFKNIFCSPLIDTKIHINHEEISRLFGEDLYGVKCMGEDGEQMILESGGRRPIVCVIKSENETEYEINVTEIKSLMGAPQEEVDKWIVDTIWEGQVNPQNDTEAVVMFLDIPSNIPRTTLKIILESTNRLTGIKRIHHLYLDVEQISFSRKLQWKLEGILC
jgi:hypothetical protein